MLCPVQVADNGGVHGYVCGKGIERNSNRFVARIIVFVRNGRSIKLKSELILHRDLARQLQIMAGRVHLIEDHS